MAAACATCLPLFLPFSMKGLLFLVGANSSPAHRRRRRCAELLMSGFLLGMQAASAGSAPFLPFRVDRKQGHDASDGGAVAHGDGIRRREGGNRRASEQTQQSERVAHA